MKDLKTNYKKCKGVEAEVRKSNRDASQYLLMNHIECMILKRYQISKSCYYKGDVQGNDIYRLIARDLVVFEEIKVQLLIHKSYNAYQQEIELNCINYGRLYSLMDSIFSKLHMK